MAKQRKIVKSENFKIGVDLSSINRLKITLAIMIAVFAFMLYSQSIKHDYTIDDFTVISENSLTTKGISGIPIILKTDYWYGFRNELRGPIYRPTSLIIYAIVWQFSPNNPHIYHLINVLFYSLSSLILFYVLIKLFKDRNLLFPFIGALIYTTHPIHTEVVNNIKSLDEILCFLFALISIWFFLKYTEKKSIINFIIGGTSFYLALISKETGITFLVIIPLILYFFTDTSFGKNIPIYLLLIALTGIYLIIRGIVFTDLPPNLGIGISPLNNALNAAPDFLSRLASVFYILIKYVVLLIFPHPLTCDYNYAHINVNTYNDPFTIIGLIFYTGLGIFSVINLKKKNIIAFGFLFFVITISPVSNIFFLGGTAMAERFLYIPSFGFCLILTYFLIKFTKTESIKSNYRNFVQFFVRNSTIFLVVFVLVSLYSVKVFSRNKDWKDNLTIYSRDIKVSDKSATANAQLGISLLLKVEDSPNKKNQIDTLNIARQYLSRAVEIYPNYSLPFFHLGILNSLMENDEQAIQNYSEAIRINQNYSDSYLNRGNILKDNNRFEEAINDYSKVIDLNPNYTEVYYNRGIVFFNLNKFDLALKDFNKAIELNPKYIQAYINQGSIYFKEKKYKEATISFTKVIEINSNESAAYFFKGWAEYYLGNSKAACIDMNKAASLGYKSAEEALKLICN